MSAPHNIVMNLNNVMVNYFQTSEFGRFSFDVLVLIDCWDIEHNKRIKKRSW